MTPYPSLSEIEIQWRASGSGICIICILYSFFIHSTYHVRPL